ncbi:MAG: 4-hydroxybenzoate octaprenyltransferase [Planctomycetaceae bacterium]|nr:MAG: 4-hydroxybenzoate octaprenyltransferase [Planctomycetaceae bacterium]
MTTAADRPAGLARLPELLGLIRFSHTLFALPFAALATVMAICTPLDGATVAVGWRPLLGILLCMVFARSTAMAFNRLVDRSLDGANPRTAGRHLPAGILSVAEVTRFTWFCGLGFVAATLLFLPNRLPLYAAVPVLGWLCGYSLAKRFTAAAHLWLGVALALSPLCVWLALRGWVTTADLTAPLLLGGAIAAWVTGFDIIYACQDADFDARSGLHSIPARYGVVGALRIAAGCHAVTLVLLAVLPWLAPELGLGWLWWSAVGLVGGLLIYEHLLVSPNDLQRVNIAFFHVNSTISLILLVAGGLDCWLR